MADDIDIEEHDVLDNPAIRNIFPDISVIKEEISKYYEDVPNVKTELEIAADPKNQPEDPIIHKKADETAKQVNQQSFNRTNASIHTSDDSVTSKSNKWENPSHGNKIILGSKSETKSLKWEKPFQGTKIILGSKPNKVVEQAQDEEIYVNREQNISLNSVVRIPKLLLQDLGEYIYQSNRYCEHCKTLFPSKSDFSDHELKLHSIKIQKEIIKLPSSSVNEINKCDLCGLNFSFKSGLSRHYKNIHQKKREKEVNNDNNNGNVIQTRNKQLNLKVTLDKVKCSKKAVTKKKLNMRYRRQNAPSKKITCTICGLNFQHKSNLYRHYKNIHKKVSSKKLKQKNNGPQNSANNSSCKSLMNKATPLQRENDKHDARNKCFHCNELFPDKNCLIEHMYTVLELKHLKRKPRLDPIIEPTSRELSDIKGKGIRMKDKLMFENQDSDESESSSIDSEIKNNDKATKIKSDKKNITSATLKNKQTDSLMISVRSLSDDESQSDEFSPKLFENKREHDWSDDDDTDEDWDFPGNNEANENHSSDESNLSNKKRKLKTKNINSKKSKSENSDLKTIDKQSQNIKNHKQKVKLKTKKAKPKNRLLTRISKNKTGIHPNVTDKISLQSVFVYECTYCSYICSSPRAYCMHISGKHRVENISQVNKVIFEKQCKFCPFRTSKLSHNRHLRLCHYNLLHKPYSDETEDMQRGKKTVDFKNSDFNKVESFVLKSIVYKCTKCDVHFLSSCVAKDHEKHMELLVNWKCSICKKIFKMHDKQLHLKQHKFTKTVNVCQFDESELSRLLYNCTKCAIHFTEERYLEHYSQCGNQTTDAVYCKNCDILIDKCGYDKHKASHSTGKNIEDIVVITGDIITKSQEKDNDLMETNSHEELGSQEDKNQSEVVMSSTIYSPMNCLTFCQFCKCYLSDVAVNRKSHIEGRCSKIVKYTCPTCGLVLTNKTINTHRDHHKKQKGLRLQDFEFFDFKGIQIRPPIPEYPSCNNCDVIFVGRNAVTRHICSETEYLTCGICNVKLSESAFRLHMNFHNYCMPNEKADQLIYIAPRLQQNNIDPEEDVKILNPGINAVLPKTCELETVVQTESKDSNDKSNLHASSIVLCNMLKKKTNHLQTVEAIESPLNPGITAVLSKTCESETVVQTESQEGNDKSNLHASSSVMCNMLKEKTNNSQSMEIESPLNQNIGTAAESEQKNPTDNTERSNIILYTCQSCNISIDTYDKVILHCQNHFSPNPETASAFKICSKCSLKFEIDSIEIHEKTHLECNTIQVLTFDPTYFTSDNNIWLDHIFASASPSVKKETIEKSIYRHERRIKIEVIQQGPSYLTVYKCYKCGTFIDADCLVSHITDGCKRKIGKYPCSLCGLPFISFLSRTKHEILHKKYENVRLKSYNILLINCEAHAAYNASIIKASKQYVLYQCRTCSGIVEKLQRNHHKCNVENLRKCLICGLMLYNDDFHRHVLKHSDLALYNTDNIKVILFGDPAKTSLKKTLHSSFKGLVLDFKLYKCSKCEECENDDKSILHHVCTFDDSKWKCPRCGLNISALSIKSHIKKHDIDTEFNKDNFMIVNFNSTTVKDNNVEQTKETRSNNNNESLNKRAPEIKVCRTEHEKDPNKAPLQDLSGNNSQNSVDEDQSTKLITLYKCTCGLHYMEETAAKNHAKHCCPKMKIIRQNCSKCSLTFNPKELFSHILAHHGDKNKSFKYKFIEVKARR